MRTLDFLGLEASEAKATVVEMQQLLADLHVFYMNLRGYHWNIEGEQFFLLHEQFEELYDAVEEQIDEVAERILMLGENPESKFSNYLKIAKIQEAGLVKDTKGTVEGTLQGIKAIMDQIKKVVEVADQGTAELVGAYLGGYEKKVWMLVAFMK